MKKFSWILALAAVCWIGSCKKKEFVNPFDDPSLDKPIHQDTTPTPDPNSIQGLHANFFGKTCANSGCHDGTFEPDFRTVESTYSTLVYHPVIKNDTFGSFIYRVTPGDFQNSVLYHRLTTDIDGQSGIMPLAVDPDSDWPAKKNDYIQNIVNWISDGAKDMFGNTAVAGKYKPQISGIAGFSDGATSPLSRKGGGLKEIEVPDTSTQLDLWFSITDVETPQQNLTYLKLKFSTNPYLFDNSPEVTLALQGSPITEKGYFGTNVQYYYMVSIDPSIYTPGTTMFMRVYVQDESTDITEIPTNGSADYIKEYAAYHIE